MSQKKLFAGLVVLSVSTGALAIENKGIPKNVATRSWSNQTTSYAFNNTTLVPGYVAANRYAIAMLKFSKNGSYKSLFTSGKGLWGAKPSDNVLNIMNVIKPDKLYASGNAFLALSSTSGTAVIWGKGVEEGKEPTFVHIKEVYPGPSSFVLVGNQNADDYVVEYKPKTNKTKVIDGVDNQNPVVAVYHSGGEVAQPTAWLLTTSNGDIKVWGSNKAGGKLPAPIETALIGQRVVEAYTTERSFLVKTDSNKWLAWDGDDSNNSAGEIPESINRILNFDPTVTIQANKGAYFAQGVMGGMVWGDEKCGGTLTGEDHAVFVSMQNPIVDATQCGFIATEDDGSKVLWWGDEHFDGWEATNNRSGVLLSTSNNGGLITSGEGDVLWALGEAELSEQAENVFNIASSESIIVSGTSFASINRSNNERTLVSWASGAAIFNGVNSCNKNIETYSTQGPDDGGTDYYFAYHPKCGDSKFSEWSYKKDSVAVDGDSPIFGFENPAGPQSYEVFTEYEKGFELLGVHAARTLGGRVYISGFDVNNDGGYFGIEEPGDRFVQHIDLDLQSVVKYEVSSDVIDGNEHITGIKFHWTNGNAIEMGKLTDNIQKYEISKDTKLKGIEMWGERNDSGEKMRMTAFRILIK